MSNTHISMSYLSVTINHEIVLHTSMPVHTISYTSTNMHISIHLCYLGESYSCTSNMHHNHTCTFSYEYIYPSIVISQRSHIHVPLTFIVIISVYRYVCQSIYLSHEYRIHAPLSFIQFIYICIFTYFHPSISFPGL